MADDFRIRPHNLDAEQGLLGSIILSGGDEAGRKFDDLMAMLSVECLADEFYSEHNRLIYQAIMDLWNDKSVVDVVTIQDRLGGKEQLERVGGARYLADLAVFVPTPGHARAYAAIVREKAVCRAIIEESARLAEEAHDGIVGDMLQRAESTFNKIADRAKVDGAMVSLIEVTGQAIADTEANRDFACKTGLARIDKMLQGGLYRGELTILAARPGKGKTSLALQMCVKEPRGGTVFISSEMSRQQLMRRAIGIMADVDWSEVRKRGGMEHSEAERAQYALDQIGNMNLEVMYSPRIKPREIRAFVRSCMNRWDGKLDLVAIDYLQLIEPDTERRRRDIEVGDITRAMKVMAGELDCPVLLLCQLIRSLDREGHDQRPQLGHLKESGSIEADADNVMFLWSEAPKKGETVAGYFQTYEDDVNLTVAKQRNGPTGQEMLRMEKRYTRFY